MPVSIFNGDDFVGMLAILSDVLANDICYNAAIYAKFMVVCAKSN